MWAPLCVSLLVLAGGQLSAGDTPRPRTEYSIPRTESPIKVDAKLDEPGWQEAARIELQFETRPGENIPPPVETECLVTYDSSQVYIAFKAYDENPQAIRAHMVDRDTAFNDDFVGVVLDTFNDERRAFEFFVNPLGVQMDLFNDDLSHDETTAWDAIWFSAGRITEEGYVVEMAIPFHQLRFPSEGEEQTWGFDAIRFYPRSDRVRIASQPMDRGVSCYLCQISKATGFEGASAGRNIELVPTLTAGRSDEREDFPEGDLQDGSAETELGLTAKWGITPSLTGNLALNPDFSQVEADVAQLDVNNPFALFFPEQRPFFLEGADIFSTPLDAVFTRNVADPLWGGKISGKQGIHGLGVFVAQDQVTNLLFPGSEESDSDSFDFETVDSVLRYRRDFGNASAIGALFTGREGDGYHNRVAGIDGLYRITDTHSLRFQALGSQSLYPDEIAEDFDQQTSSFSDQAYLLAYSHDSRNWQGWAEYRDIGEDFRADMGFMPQVDFRHGATGFEHSWWGEESDWYNRIELGSELERKQDQSGQLLHQEWRVWSGVGGPLQSFLWLNLSLAEQGYEGEIFDTNAVRTFIRVQPSGVFSFEMFARVGGQVDFDNVRQGNAVRLDPWFRVNLGRHFQANLSHTYEQLDVDEGRLFTANLSQLRFVYQFNIRTFVRAIVQYTDIDRDLSLYDDPEDVDAQTETVFSQLLFSYKVNPRTVLFLGYSENREGSESIDLL
ncbi:MAG: DUF5916 domain-containing protein, partial [Thermoanaerobaculia bacterium]